MDAPNLSGLSLRALAPRTPPRRAGAPLGMEADEVVVVPGCGYDPTEGGEGIQAYFSDMLLDSDRNARYAEAIYAAVQSFRAREGRAPVVLDAGCGTGLLTLFALAAGAERAIAVDVNKEHTDRILGRLGAPFNSRCTPVHIGDDNPFAGDRVPAELRFDMLVSEILGTFANSECESYYLPQYATHMNVHASGNVYCVPHRVFQTVRRILLPSVVQEEMDREWDNEYMPTEFVGWHYDMTPPKHLAAPLLVRTDDFSAYPFRVELPSVDLQTGYYVAEWEAELWPGAELKPLSNTWSWAYHHDQDAHSQHARARAWGLMLFYVYETSRVNYGDPTSAASLHSTMPPIVSENGTSYQVTVESKDEDERFDALRFAFPYTDEAGDANYAAQEDLNVKMEALDAPGAVYTGDDRLEVYISMKKIAAGLPQWVPLDALYRMTLGAILEGIEEANPNNQWLQTLDVIGVLPFVVSPEKSTPNDVRVSIIPPRGAAADPYRYLTVGAGFHIEE